MYPRGTEFSGVQNGEMGDCTPKWGTFGNPVTHSCSGGMFDNLHSFEHDFFPQISRSCPLLSRLTLLNKIKQKFKQSQQLTKSKASSIIEDPP